MDLDKPVDQWTGYDISIAYGIADWYHVLSLLKIKTNYSTLPDSALSLDNLYVNTP